MENVLVEMLEHMSQAMAKKEASVASWFLFLFKANIALNS